MKDLIKEVEFYSVLFNYYYISYLQKKFNLCKNFIRETRVSVC